MLCILNPETDPYFNLASEEYVLRNIQENCFMLWRSIPSIVVGKHQNALAEINYQFVKNKKIDVIRRLSGGGTVFHDLGNVNFTFIENAKDKNNLVDFKKYTQPIIEVLHQLGVDAKFEGRNDIMVGGRKISGNAEHVYKKRVLHHGTLLFDSKISSLSEALKVNPLKYSDKGVKSVRSRVANISNYLANKMEVKDFIEKIYDFIKTTNTKAQFYEFNQREKEEIKKLSESKYKTWEWNFGYSPKYSFEKLIETSRGTVEIEMQVDKGVIHKITIKCEPESIYIDEIEKALIGCKHKESEIYKKLELKLSNNFFKTIALPNFVSNLF